MNRLMSRMFSLVLLVSLAGCAVSFGQVASSPATSTPDGPVTVSYFYDALSDDGQWFQDSDHGWCWTPYDVSADWRPYSDGHWEYTDYGWSWASNEPFGWATYHYGRWFMDDAYGWAWMPGTDWAPAWVAWRTDADYVGWAPLPPAAGWNETSGLASGDMGSVPTDAWCFVPRDHMMDASVGVQVTSVARNVTLLDGAQDETRFEVRGGHPFNVGIDINLFEKSIGRPVPRQRIVDVAAPARSDHRAEGGTVGYYRPAIHPPMPDRPPVPTPAMQRRAVPMPEPDMQRVRDDHQRKLESDLANEHTRLVNDQQAELRRQTDASATEALRQRQVVEQKAFEVHATRQRQVMGQRMQKQVVRPAKGNAKSKDNGNGKDKGRDNGGH